MVASTEVKEGEGGLIVRDENTQVSLEQAAKALRRALDLLDSSKRKNEAWQDSNELLDISAAALDDAALALKSPGEEDEEYDCNDEFALVPIFPVDVEKMAESVLKKRNAILDEARTVMTGKWHEDIPEDETLIVWATQTETSKKFALSLKDNLSLKAVNIKDLYLADLQRRQRVYFICSTFGCGRPPRDAEVFFSMLQILGGKEGSISILSGLEFAVAALGNSKFTNFCKFGHDLSERLEKLGADKIIPFTTLDSKKGKADQKKAFAEWQNKVLELEGKPPILTEQRSKQRTMGRGEKNFWGRWFGARQKKESHLAD